MKLMDFEMRIRELEDAVARIEERVPPLRVTTIRPGAVLPVYGTPEAAGADVAVPLTSGSIVIAVGNRIQVETGLQLHLAPGWEVQVRPRSGLALKHGVTVLNAPGTIDSDYTGELKVLLVNHGVKPFTLNAGERIAQLVVARIVRPEIVLYEGPTRDTARGAGGFGSTGA